MFPDWDYEYEDAKCLVCGKRGRAYSAEYVCNSCRADAALGRAVRKMPCCSSIQRVSAGDFVALHDDGGIGSGIGRTPEAALMAAGLMEVKE